MIARPRHAANDGLVVSDSVLPVVTGLELGATRDRVREWAGDPALYATVLGAAIATLPSPDAATVRALAAVAGWRSGVLDLRDNALVQAANVPGPAAAAALAIHPGELAWFLAEQAADRFALPGSGPLIATVGGFRGFGGPWPGPPRDPRPLGNGRVAVRVAGVEWTIHLDVFGARLVESAGPAPVDGGVVHASVNPDSHLVTVSRHAL